MVEAELVGSDAARWFAPHLIRQRAAAAFATSRPGSSQPPSRWIQRRNATEEFARRSMKNLEFIVASLESGADGESVEK